MDCPTCVIWGPCTLHSIKDREILLWLGPCIFRFCKDFSIAQHCIFESNSCCFLQLQKTKGCTELISWCTMMYVNLCSLFSGIWPATQTNDIDLTVVPCLFSNSHSPLLYNRLLHESYSILLVYLLVPFLSYSLTPHLQLQFFTSACLFPIYLDK